MFIYTKGVCRLLWRFQCCLTWLNSLFKVEVWWAAFISEQEASCCSSWCIVTNIIIDFPQVVSNYPFVCLWRWDLFQSVTEGLVGQKRWLVILMGRFSLVFALNVFFDSSRSSNSRRYGANYRWIDTTRTRFIETSVGSKSINFRPWAPSTDRRPLRYWEGHRWQVTGQSVFHLDCASARESLV